MLNIYLLKICIEKLKYNKVKVIVKNSNYL